MTSPPTLSAADVSHCLVDGDFLDMAHPPPREHILAERSLSAMSANDQALGYHRMIYANTVSVLPDQITRLATAIGGNPKVIAVLLTCTDTTAAKRLSQREMSSALDQHLPSITDMGTRSQAGARRLGSSHPR